MYQELQHLQKALQRLRTFGWQLCVVVTDSVTGILLEYWSLEIIKSSFVQVWFGVLRPYQHVCTMPKLYNHLKPAFCRGRWSK
jgi:hypothetical protein